VNGSLWASLLQGANYKKECKMLNPCSKFCKGPVNTNKGLFCELPLAVEKLPSKKDRMKHNPTTKEAAHNLIKNGGRHSICFINPWKYDMV